uniref:Uncharacterized protein n=1 Tax=Rhizophora mucronata TaxID=61149 RepID=A0A2P2KRX4_RHIMU
MKKSRGSGGFSLLISFINTHRSKNPHSNLPNDLFVCRFRCRSLRILIHVPFVFFLFLFFSGTKQKAIKIERERGNYL